MNTLKYILYARKSTDVEDKQIRSIEDQIAELRAYAKTENLDVVDVLIEKQSAKYPGRPIFNDMVRRIENGEIDGIISWAPDRLARNSVDGGRLIYLLDCGQLQSMKFPTFWMDNTSQGKFMLNIAFGQSKYYVDSLSENTKRGLRQKVKRGEYPSVAPIGYLNNVRNKTIVVDKKKSPVIVALFEYYATGTARLEDASNFLAQRGILSSGGKRIHKSRASLILSNPFYYGYFKYGGELYEGKHEPIIAKKLYNMVAAILADRGRPQKHIKEPKALCGLLTCGECGMMITAETQKGHIYYRCSKKGKPCTQKYIREEELDRQLSSLLQTVSLRSDWASKMLAKLDTEQSEIAQSVTACVRETRTEISVIKSKLERLLDSYLEQDIDRDAYLNKKALLMSDKKSLEEKITDLEHTQSTRLEPMRMWIKSAENLNEIAAAPSLIPKRDAVRDIFRSNAYLTNQSVSATALAPWSFLADSSVSSSWAPRPGLEPGTIALHITQYFHIGVDYIFTLRHAQGASVSSLYGAPHLSFVLQNFGEVPTVLA